MSTSPLSRCTCAILRGSSIRLASSSSGPPARDTSSSENRQRPSSSLARPGPSGPSERSSRSSPGVYDESQQWRSSTRAGPKKTYLEESPARAAPAFRGLGRPSESYSALGGEARRREDLYREGRVKEHGQSKLYAMERERSRESSLRAGARDGGAASGRPVGRSMTGGYGARDTTGTSTYGAGASRGSPPASRSAPVVTQTYTRSDAPSSSGTPVRQDRYSLRRDATRSHATPGKATNTTKLHAGQYNRSLRDQGSERKIVQPVTRGGAPRNSEEGRGRGMGRPKVRREMKKVVLPSTIRLENLTNILGVKLSVLQRSMNRIGMENTRAERLLNAEDASLLALELNFDPVIDDESAFDIYPNPPSDDPALPLRPPVTGIFGHVDHGKTSLLDALRSTTVASGEAGGITQHIGAFEVSVASITANLRNRALVADGGKALPPVAPSEGDSTITFLDTPGHAAFTAMRERGAGVTDVVVLVVAADDGVKPQTEEVIGLIKASDVGVVVAITKVDKPGVDTAKVKQSLMAAGVEVEDFGGDIPCVEVSSVTGQGLPELLETIAAIAEVRELKAERDGRVEGRVIESRVEKGRGNVATVLVLRGALRTTASIVAGTTWCRVRQLTPASGVATNVAYPGQPVEVTGWKELPAAGDEVLEAVSEDAAKKAVLNRLRRVETEKMWEEVELINEKRRLDSAVELARKEEEKKAKANGLKGNAITAAGNLAVDGMEGSHAGSKIRELVLIIKADVSGTVEAVVGALEGIGNKEAKVKIIFSGVGDVQESDVEMAKAVEGSIVGFNVKASRAVLVAAARQPYAVPIHTSPIIYRLVETIRGAVAELLPKITETRVHGEATVQQIFEITIKGKKEPMRVAGSKVVNGVFQKGRQARVMRDGVEVHTGPVDTLKQAKKEVLEISKGTECGIALEGFQDLRVDDVIQSVEAYDVPRTL